MKKVAIVILALLYLGLSSGVVKNLHYCMGELNSVDYGYDLHDACNKCGMQEKDGCCNTEFKIVKLEDSHQWEKSDFPRKSVSLPLVENRPLLISSDQHQLLVAVHSHHSPPDHRINSLYLHTGVFLI